MPTSSSRAYAMCSTAISSTSSPVAVAWSSISSSKPATRPTPSASCRCSIAISLVAALRPARSPPMAAMPAAIISIRPKPAASVMSPFTRSAAWPSPTWPRALGSIAGCAISAPASRPASRASSAPMAGDAAHGAALAVSRPMSGLQWWPTTWRCSHASNRDSAPPAPPVLERDQPNPARLPLHVTRVPARKLPCQREMPLRDTRPKRACRLLSCSKTCVYGRALAYYGHPPTYDYDPAKAKALLKEAGCLPCKVTFGISTSGSGQMQPLPMNELVKAQLEEAGFEVTLQTMDWNAMLATSYRAGVDKFPEYDGLNFSAVCSIRSAQSRLFSRQWFA